jgi:hypothetical protein
MATLAITSRIASTAAPSPPASTIYAASRIPSGGIWWSTCWQV